MKDLVCPIVTMYVYLAGRDGGVGGLDGGGFMERLASPVASFALQRSWGRLHGNETRCGVE